MYLMGQACPWWRPPDDTSGLVILAIPEIHRIYGDLRAQQQVNLFGGSSGR